MSNTDNLKETIGSLQKEFTDNPDRAILSYSSLSKLKEGLQSKATLRDHKLTIDEPTSFGGKDEGPSPVELILAALGSCQEITYKAFATALGIDLKSVSVKLDAKLDLKGFLAIDDKTRPGFQNIDGIVKLESTAPKDQLDKLIEVVNAHCPVLDILQNKVPVKLSQTVFSNNQENETAAKVA
ncbi:OsmC family protein [Candidatus Pelagibacter sp.]|uniref:OsmC family protein n=1 Tax=Candidatus Pelagibacter sp. TaxID=2024849 RepID=UPI003D11753A